jgi:DNA-binding transcriptional LysR family regulator
LLQSGCGISVLDEFSAKPAIASGHLVRVLAAWSLPRGGLHAVYPPGRYVPAKVRAFIDFYAAWIAAR